ncbi:hypothetical protein MBLNU457_3648t3 [Dothideomycetes sp. NU457]
MASHLPMAHFPLNAPMLPSTVPLQCNICAKRPKFSDVSHLLTHIASKGHLSTYYKIKVKAGQDDTAKKLIEDYDTWYATWNIENLMSERMSLKDQKPRPRAHNSASLRGSRAGSTTSTHASHAAVDPGLTAMTIKAEPFSRSNTPFINPNALQVPYLFQPQPWFRMPYGFNNVGFKRELYDPDEEDDPSSAYSPTPSRNSRGSRKQGHVYDLATEDLGLEDGLENDANKLKGVYWPGMNMFDAATPEMRRKRNQKKATSVVEQLEALSRDIEATELVFSPSGVLRKARHISGFPNPDSSPLKGEETPPKKVVRTARRAVLAEKDANAGISRRMQRRSKPQPGDMRTADEEQNNETARMKSHATKRGRPKKRKLDVEQKENSAPQPSIVEHEQELSAYDIQRLPVSPSNGYGRPVSMAASSRFRPAEAITNAFYNSNTFHVDWNNAGHNAGGLNEYHYAPAWDFLGQDLNGTITNPLYIDDTTPNQGDDNDDQQTISAPPSDE